MDWDRNNGSYVYHGLALDTQPEISHFVRLKKKNIEFDLEIVGVNSNFYHGRIIRIGPEPILEAFELKRGDIVSFQEYNIQRLSCND